jgi:hypothetical protein
MEERFFRLVSSDESSAVQSDSKAGFGSGIMSDERIGRDNHRVMSDGLSSDNWLLSGCLQFAHDDSLLPIATPTRVNIERNHPFKPVRAHWKYAPREANPLAGQIEDLVAAGCLRALSLSWRPIDWKYSSDDTRPGGVDFLRADVIECSFVPSPALPTALIDARSRGIDTRPLREWVTRALDTRFDRIPRGDLEAMYRAVQAPMSTSDRRRRARELQAQGRRMELAIRIQQRVAQEDADDANARYEYHEARRRGEAL